MRYGYQICEGADFHTGRPCLSQAHWHVRVFLDRRGERIVDVYLCSHCHALGELDWAEKSLPRKTDYSASGYETARGHEYATSRKSSLFARVYKTQLPLTFSH